MSPTPARALVISVYLLVAVALVALFVGGLLGLPGLDRGERGGGGLLVDRAAAPPDGPDPASRRGDRGPGGGLARGGGRDGGADGARRVQPPAGVSPAGEALHAPHAARRPRHRVPGLLRAGRRLAGHHQRRVPRALRRVRGGRDVAPDVAPLAGRGRERGGVGAAAFVGHPGARPADALAARLGRHARGDDAALPVHSADRAGRAAAAHPGRAHRGRLHREGASWARSARSRPTPRWSCACT